LTGCAPKSAARARGVNGATPRGRDAALVRWGDAEAAAIVVVAGTAAAWVRCTLTCAPPARRSRTRATALPGCSPDAGPVTEDVRSVIRFACSSAGEAGRAAGCLIAATPPAATTTMATAESALLLTAPATALVPAPTVPVPPLLLADAALKRRLSSEIASRSPIGAEIACRSFLRAGISAAKALHPAQSR